MKLGIFYSTVNNIIRAGMTPAEAYAALRREGVEGVDVCEADLENMPDFEKSGLVISGVYGFFDFSVAPVDAHLVSVMEKTAKSGTKSFLCVPGKLSREDSAAMAHAEAGIRRLIELARPYGIQVSVEDFDNVTSPCCGKEGITEFLSRIPELMLCLDTGNFLYAGQEIPLEPELLSRVTHVHCKDRCLTPMGGNPMISVTGLAMYNCGVGEGCIDFPAVLAALKKAGYDDFVVMEQFVGGRSYECMCKGAAYMKRVLAQL